MKTHNENTSERLVQIPEILGGKPVIKGTRISVDLILERLTIDLDLKTLFEDYPERSYWIPGSFETSSSMSAPSNALPRFRTL